MHILAEISPLDPVSGARAVLRVSSTQSRAVTGLGNQIWWPAITKKPTISLQLFEGDFSSSVDPGSAGLELSLAGLAKLNANARRMIWPGAPVTLRAGNEGQAWPWATVMVGRVVSFRSSKGALAITVEVDQEPFEAKVPTALYAGTTGIEGGADLKGKVKPLCLGTPRNVEPILINAVDNVYQLSAGGPLTLVETLYERGSAFPVSSGDYANYNALVAATIANGRWATCLAQGLIRLGAPAAGIITADVRGDTTGSVWARKPGAIIRRVCDLAGISSSLIDTASLDALDAAAIALPAGGNISLVLTEQEAVLDVARRVARACNWQAGVDLLGRLFVTRPSFGTPSLTLDAQGRRMPPVLAPTVEVEVSPPYKRVQMGGARSWRVHSFEEIAFQATLIDRGAYDAGTTYREGNIVSLANGSRWVFVGTTPAAGSLPAVGNANWQAMADAPQVGLGTNTVINSEFKAGLTGFAPGWDGNTGFTPIRALTTDTNWTGVVKTAYAAVVGTPTASTGFDGYTNLGDTSLAFDERLKRWALPVVPGDRLYFSILLGIHRCHGYTVCAFVDEDGNYVGESGGNLVTNAAKDFYLGDPEDAETSGAFATVPSSLSAYSLPARYAVISPRAIMTGGGDPYLFFGRYFLAKVAAGQTVPPIYGTGPGDPRADVTGENTAADTSNVNGVPAATITANITQALTDAANAAALADSKIDTFYQALFPSGASLGDLWFDTDDGNKQYRFDGSSWVPVADTRLGLAISAAANAQATADGKVTTYRQSGPPSGAVLGDLWSDTDDDILYRWSGTAWQEVAKVGADGDPGISPRVLTFSKASVALASDWNGLNVRGLPVSFKATLTEGGTDVSSSASWFIDAPASGVTVSSNGTVTVSSISISGEIAVRAVYSGSTYSGKMPVTITKDPAPPQGNTSVFIDTVAISTSTSQPAAPNSGTALLTTTSAGQLVVSGGIDYNVSAGSGGGLRSFTARAIVYYRIAGSGGSWTAFSAGAAVGYQSRTGEIDADYINEPGGVYFDQVQGSLAADTEYEIGVAAWKHSGTGTAFDSVVGGITVALV
jgi:hypothetical protein